VSAAPALAGASQRRLSGLAETYRLGDDQVAALTALVQLIASDPYAPTTVRDPVVAMDQHIADSLVALELDVVRDASAAADLGAGAGLPGLVLAAALPRCAWTLLDSVARKVEFIERAIQAMKLANAAAVYARAEEWRDGVGGMALVTARAVAAAPVVLEYAAPLLRSGGTLVDWRTEMSAADEGSARAAADELGLELRESRRVVPFKGAHSRFLYVYVKVRPTPDRFPRRPGSARKRPLGTSIRPSS
jgi:16S rRNA (guanine527-N7)-methyltransferase